MIGADRPPSGVKALQSILAYFSHNHRLTNLLFILVLTGGVISWLNLKKEEMPEFETNWLRISASYPGASADDIEQRMIECVRLITNAVSIPVAAKTPPP